MKSKEYNYIKLCYLVKYVFIAIFVIRALFLKIFYGKEMNDLILGLIIWSVVILKRRMEKLPIPKENSFNWNKKGEVGVFFTDPEKGTFWFCSNQTNYDLYVYPIAEFRLYENNTTIFFEKAVGDCDLKKFKILKPKQEI